jgi:hypothetical protein
VAADPDEAAAKLPLALLGAPPELETAVARALEASPRLRLLDRLIEGLPARPPVAGASGLQAARALLLSAPPDADPDALLAALPPLSRDSIRDLLGELRDLERKEIQSLPDLARTRDLRGTILENADRSAAYRLVNQLSALRGDGIQVLELPLRRPDGPLSRLPLVVRRDGGGGRGPGTSDGLSITVHAELPRLGLVHAFLQASGRLLRVRLTARSAWAVEALQRDSAVLVRTLEALGFEATVRAEAARGDGRESIFDVFAAPGSPGELDVQA